MAFAVQRITGRTHRSYDIGLAAVVDRLPEATDVDVDGARLDVAVVAPHGIEQPLAGEDAAGVLPEVAQQAEFGRAERDRRSEEHTYELQSLLRISYAAFCLNN